MTLEQLENLMGRAGLTQHQTRELLPAIDAYATTQCETAIDLIEHQPMCGKPAGHTGKCSPAPLWHALTLTPEVGSRCGAVGVNTTNTRLVNCPDCLKEGSP